VTVLWDTSLASRVRPESAELEHLNDQRTLGTPVRLAAPAVLEIAYGYQRIAALDDRAPVLLAWFTTLIDDGSFAIVPFDGRAGIVAGRLRAEMRHPPPRPKDHRSKTMRQASWLLDIQIAATAFAGGLDVATRNREDFEVLADALAELFPQAPPLLVFDGQV
jgi:predicted nucleic acid-binding protein